MIYRSAHIILLLFLSFNLWGQRVIDFDFMLQPPYPRTISELINNQRLNVTVNNDISESIEIFFAAELFITDPLGNEIGSIRTSFDRFFTEEIGIGSSVTLGPNESRIVDRAVSYTHLTLPTKA